MTQIYDDLEIAGNLTVSGAGGGPIKIVSLVLRTTGIPVGAHNIPQTGQIGGMLIPIAAAGGDPGGLWNDSTAEFTAGEDGEYEFVIDRLKSPFTYHAHNNAFMYFHLDTGGGYVLYSLGNAESRGSFSTGGSYTRFTSFRINLSTGDKIKFSLVNTTYHNRIGWPIHNGNTDCKIEIWKI